MSRASRPRRRGLLRWILFAAAWVALFGGFTVLCAIGEITAPLNDGTELRCPPALGAALLLGWAALTVSLLTLMWPSRGPHSDATLSAGSTWVMWGMFIGVVMGALAGILWLLPPVLDGRLDANAWLGTGSRAMPVWAMLAMLGVIVVGVCVGVLRIVYLALRAGDHGDGPHAHR